MNTQVTSKQAKGGSVAILIRVSKEDKKRYLSYAKAEKRSLSNAIARAAMNWIEHEQHEKSGQ